MSVAAPDPARYPPASMAARAMDILARLPGNSFAPPSPSRPADTRARAFSQELGLCSRVLELPSSAEESPDFYFGREDDGYIIVSPRKPCSEWPLCGDGRPMPLRLSRWVASAPPGNLVLHRCDDTSCVRRSHLRIGTWAQNLEEAFMRDRRRVGSSPAASGGGVRRATRRHHDLTPASRFPDFQDPRERVFPVAGFCSPSKAARKRSRACAARAPAPYERLSDGTPAAPSPPASRRTGD
jgi:hypothetical protein